MCGWPDRRSARGNVQARASAGKGGCNEGIGGGITSVVGYFHRGFGSSCWLELSSLCRSGRPLGIKYGVDSGGEHVSRRWHRGDDFGVGYAGTRDATRALRLSVRTCKGPKWELDVYLMTVVVGAVVVIKGTDM